jgi:hypothetical protein
MVGPHARRALLAAALAAAAALGLAAGSGSAAAQARPALDLPPLPTLLPGSNLPLLGGATTTTSPSAADVTLPDATLPLLLLPTTLVPTSLPETLLPEVTLVPTSSPADGATTAPPRRDSGGAVGGTDRLGPDGTGSGAGGAGGQASGREPVAGSGAGEGRHAPTRARLVAEHGGEPLATLRTPASAVGAMAGAAILSLLARRAVLRRARRRVPAARSGRATAG